MRLICPNCDAQYEVDDGAIPPGGRDVQCSNCGHAWFQTHADLEDEGDDEGSVAIAPVAAPASPLPAAQVPDVPDDVPAVPADVPPAPVRRTLDENLLAVLREEAAREAAERRAEATRSIETQPDLGLPEAGRRPPPVAPVAAPEPPVPDHPVTERPNPRRDLLPDIEEINSTLRPGSEARDEDAAAALPPPPKRGAFRSGFFSVVLVALVLVMVYALAPHLAARFPAAAAALTSYVAAVDALRLWLDGLMQSAAGALQGLSGEG